MRTRAKTADGQVKAWLRALRNGEYSQGVGGFRTKVFDDGNVSFCCLGVLDDITDVIDPSKDPFYIRAYFMPDHNERRPQSTLNPELVGWLTAPQEQEYGITTHQTILAKMNDVGGTFTQIANYIEEKWSNRA